MTLLKVKNNGLKNFFETRPMFGELFNNVLDSSLSAEFTRSTVPAVNIKENENQFSISLAAPGLTKEDFKINMEDDVLTISTERSEEKNEENERFTRKEFSYSTFKRSFNLPETIDSAKITAAYENGILNIALPKREEAKPKPAQEIKIS